MRTFAARRFRRWDLALLAGLLLLPAAFVFVVAVARLDVRAERDALQVELDALAAAGSALPAEPERRAAIEAGAHAWRALAGQPFDVAAAADLDAVIAGERAPWQLSRETWDHVARRGADVGLILQLASDNAWVRGIEAPPRETWIDLGRHLAVVSIQARSRGDDEAADAVCAAGLVLAAHWPLHGDLVDVLDADALVERLWRRCSDEMQIDRAAFSALDLPTADLDLAARRRAAGIGTRFHLAVVGPLPRGVAPLRWTVAPGAPDGTFTRLLLADRWRREARCLAGKERGRQPRADGDDLCDDVERQRQRATEALRRRRLERSLLIGRIALEEAVEETGVWPTTIGALTIDEPGLAALLRDPVTQQPFSIVVHEPYATLMAVGAVAQSVRASRPDGGG